MASIPVTAALVSHTDSLCGLTSAARPSRWQPASPAGETSTAFLWRGWRGEPAGCAPAAAGPHLLQPSELAPVCLPPPACNMESAINPWAAGHIACFVIALTPKGILCSFLLHAVSLIGALQVADDLACCCCCYVMQYGWS